MYLMQLIICSLLAISGVVVNADPPLQGRIDRAVGEILRSKIGQAICTGILGSRTEALAFHLGVSRERAELIARDCEGMRAQATPWVVETSSLDIEKLTLVPFKPRRYAMDQSLTSLPIDSWTDPFSNITTLFFHDGQVSNSKLVQLLAHELAVYFDGKANPAHPDAQRLAALRDLKWESIGSLNPLVVVSDPLVAHTLTFIRALQVEYAIVDELVAAGRIAPPADYSDPSLRFIISESCRQNCLMSLVMSMRKSYLPMGLPLLAYAPHFRSAMSAEILRVSPPWSSSQWSLYQRSFNQYPAEYIRTEVGSDRHPPDGVTRMFDLKTQASDNFRSVTTFMRDELWALEEPVLRHTRLVGGETLLEFMKRPLLSGQNISLSSGPRVRVGPGIVE